MRIKRTLAAALAVAMLALPFAGCGKDEKPEPTEAATAAVSTSASIDEPVPTTLAETTSAQTAPSTAKATAARTTSSAPMTQGTTAKPVQGNIPADTISYANINPNIGSIQNIVANEINELYVRFIGLSKTKLTLTEGESETISISFNPTNAAIKTCTAEADNSCVSVSVKGKTVTIKAKTQGSSLVIVKAHSGASASCRVTVKAAEITDDTPLSHRKLCTENNAQRWCENLRGLCESLGMTYNAGLSGGSVSIGTVSFAGDASYNEMLSKLRTALTSQLQAHTGDSFSDYEFNITYTRGGGEVMFSVPLNRLEKEE